MRLFRSLALAGAGAVAAYLLDPISGRGRRARLSDQAASRVRRAGDEVASRARYEAGRAKGIVHEMGSATDHPVDDGELLQKVRSEADGPSSLKPSDSESHVDAGVVTIRGGSRDVQAEKDLLRRIESVTGVREVRNELATV